MHGPADLAEVIPTLAGRMPWDGAVDDLDRQSARLLAHGVPNRFQDRLEPLSMFTPQPAPIESPTRAIRNVPAGLSSA